MWEFRINKNNKLCIYNPVTREEILRPSIVPIIVNGRKFKINIKHEILEPTLEQIKQNGDILIPEHTFQIFRLYGNIIDFFNIIIAVNNSSKYFRHAPRMQINGIVGKTLWIDSIRDFIIKYEYNYNDQYPEIFKWFSEIINIADSNSKKYVNYNTELIKKIIEDKHLISLIAEVTNNNPKFDYLNRFITVENDENSDAAMLDISERLSPFLNKKLLLSDPEHFNDPFDCKRPFDPDELHNLLHEKGISSVDERNRLLLECKADLALFEKSHSVCSFSLVDPLRIVKNKLLTNVSSSLWGHYANMGHGFVVSYDLCNVMQEIDRLADSGLLGGEVMYDDNYLFEYVEMLKQYYNQASSRYINHSKDFATHDTFINFNRNLKGFTTNLIINKATQWESEWEFRIHKHIDNMFRPVKLPVEKTLVRHGLYYDKTHPDEQLKFINLARKEFFNIANRFHCHDDFLFPDRIIIGWKMNDEKVQYIVDKVKECNKKNNLKIEVITILSDNNRQPYFTAQGFYKTKFILSNNDIK